MLLKKPRKIRNKRINYIKFHLSNIYEIGTNSTKTTVEAGFPKGKICSTIPISFGNSTKFENTILNC